ncbi:PIN domain-containing protein [Sphingomonas yunnanensis]|nr:PIN domain-containing protein [Sphingomonas yunnanensis]
MTRDEEQQAALADAVLSAPTLITLTVLIEVAWVLRQRYAFDRAGLNAALATLISLEHVSVEQEVGVRWALARHAAGGDLPDMLHLVAAIGARAFITFDRRLAQHAGADAPLAIETLA